MVRSYCKIRQSSDVWKKGFDIIFRWNEIDRAVKAYNDRKRK
jgi:hypothetical protein